MELNRSDHPYVTDLKAGDSFDSFFVLQSIRLATTRQNKPFLTLDLTDKTGQIQGKVWDDAENVYRALTSKSIIKVRAQVLTYMGQLELKILNIRTISPQDVLDKSRFLPTSERDPDEDWAIIDRIHDGMRHAGLKSLLSILLEDDEFRKQFELAPAGKKWHHGYIGGLLEHTASMMKLASRVCDHYSFLDRDLLLSGVFFHDLGKIWELSFDTSIDYSVDGRLLGHIVLGAEYIGKLAANIDELDERTVTLLRHLVLSHQGALENGTPVLPKTREAFVLYFLDEIDSKLNAINRELEKVKRSDEPFTGYIKLLDRMLYRGESQSETKHLE